MKRLTALVAAAAMAVSTTATAQVNPAPPPAVEAPGAGTFLAVQAANQILLSDLLGHPVVNMADETLGGIDTLVLTPGGQITAVVIGVGGFLGIGKKDVAIPFDALERRVDDEGVASWYFDATREALDAAPGFVRLGDNAETPAVPAAPFVAAQSPDEIMLEDVRGRPIKNLADETLGNVDGLVFTEDGQIVAVIVGVGGFLGIGERSVAIAFDALQAVTNEDGDFEWLFDGTTETIGNAPEFMTQAQAEDTAIQVPEVAAQIDEGGGLPVAGFADIAAEVTPAVVSVRVRMPAPEATQMANENPLAPFFDRFGAPETQPHPYNYGEGSGFFISADGFVVTNNHVVAGADQVMLQLGDGSVYPARVIGVDPRTDIALLKVDADRVFPFVTFSDDDVRIGDWILAVGNPFGLGGTVTLGIVSALGRDIGAGPYDDFMQIDASINRGNSGGPAFNIKGEVIGVNTAIASPTGASVGIGFAIPAYIVTEVVADLQDDGLVQRGWLGVQIQSVDANIAEALGLDGTAGALVVGAGPDTPAERAGIRSQDVITAVNDNEVQNSRQLARMVAAYDPGEQVRLTIWRDRAEVTIDVVLGELPGEQAAAPATPPATQTPPTVVEGLGLALAPAANLGDDRRGVLVAAVEVSGAAAAAGLQPGDIILDVAGVATDTPDQFSTMIAQVRSAGGGVVLVRVQSGDQEGIVALRLD